MTEHLPECWATCICDELRACEARVTALATPGTVEQRAYWYEHGQRDERERIRAACIEMKHHDGCACDVIDTLNRIDAIKGEQND